MQTEENNVLIIVENLPVPLDRRVWLEAKALNEKGYNVSVICPKTDEFRASREILDGINIYRHYLPEEVSSVWGYLREYSIALIMQLYLSILIKFRHGIDLIQICNPPDILFIVAGFHKLFFRTKVIFDHHDLNPEMYSEKFGRKDLFYQLLFLFEKLTFSLSDVVISTNKSYRKVAIERGGKSIEDIYIVQSSPNTEEYLRKDAPNSSQQMVIGYVGIIGETDGVDNMVAVAHYVLKEYSKNVIFRVVGGGPALPSIRDLVKKKNLEKYFDFTGMVTDKKELIRVVSTFTVGIVPDPKTSYSDKCTMNKILEYMSLEIPFVYFDLTESKRIAGNAGICIEADDVDTMAKNIVNLLEDPELRKQMGLRGRQIMEKDLNWNIQKQELLKAYSKVFS